MVYRKLFKVVCLIYLCNTKGVTSCARVTYPFGALEVTLELLGFCLFSFSFQCRDMCSVCVVSFILFVMVLSAFLLNDFCRPLWYLQIPLSFFSENDNISFYVKFGSRLINIWVLDTNFDVFDEFEYFITFC